MKKYYFISLLIIMPLFSMAQGSKKNVYVELAGPGFLSVNFDTRLSKSNSGVGIRAGMGTIFDFYGFGFTLPVGINYLIGTKKNFLELGTGVSYIHFKEQNQDSPFDFPKENFLLGYGWVGYKYQPLQQGFTFRAGLCQYFNDLNLPVILGVPSLYPSLSFGYSF